MGITYRKIKNAPLTVEELDENFRCLDIRIYELEKSPKIIPAIKMEQLEDKIKFSLIDGGVLGEIPIPKFSITPRGQWEKSTCYLPADIVFYKNVVWWCISKHTSLDFERDLEEGNWQLFYKIG